MVEDIGKWINPPTNLIALNYNVSHFPNISMKSSSSVGISLASNVVRGVLWFLFIKIRVLLSVS